MWVSILFVLSCGENNIQISADDLDIVVTCIIADTDTTQQLLIDQASSPTGLPSNRVIDDALVKILIPNAQMNSFELCSSTVPAIYCSHEVDFFKTYGATYKLSIEHPSFDPITSQQILPHPPKVKSFQYIESQMSVNNTETCDVVKIVINNVQEGQSYYQIEIFYVNKFGRIQNIATGSESNFIQQTFNNALVLTITNPMELELEINLDKSVYDSRSDKLFCKLSAITSDKLDYLEALRKNELLEFNPLLEPLIFPSNLENGLGIFSLASNILLELN